MQNENPFTSRTALVLGEDALESIKKTRAIVVGAGGVGSWCAEALVRTGLEHITVADADVVCPTNINRQSQAFTSTTGLMKVEAIASRLADINPHAEIKTHSMRFSHETLQEYSLSSYDYVIDAIDSVADKIFLIEECLAAGIPIISSMGAAGKSDPGRITISDISKTHSCPLARLVRQRLRKDGMAGKLPCVWSSEAPVRPATSAAGTEADTSVRTSAEAEGASPEDMSRNKRQINGALVFVTSVFGMMMAGAVIRDAAGIKKLSDY